MFSDGYHTARHLAESTLGCPGSASTLVELVQRRADAHPNRTAITFLVDGDSQEAHLTYGDLDRWARAIGAGLERRGHTGERALLFYPPGLEFITAFFGCLYAGVTAIPAYPPHPARLERDLPRVRAIVDNAEPAVTLTTRTLRGKIEEIFSLDSHLQAMGLLATDETRLGDSNGWSPPVFSSESSAFFQYTSGSTATPKGVMVSHRNILDNCYLIHRLFGTSEESNSVFWLPFYHDMGLVGGILKTIYCGGQATLLSPLHFIQRPYRWLRAISRTGASVSGGPNFAYDLCARKITPEEKSTLDLSHWEVGFSGSETIRAHTLDRFAEAFEPCGFRREVFYPCYGLAEATLIVTGGKITEPPVVRSYNVEALEKHQVVESPVSAPGSRRIVGCGQIPPGRDVRVVNPDTGVPVPEDGIGEIWVGGPSVAQGYWHRPEQTSHTFGAYLIESQEGPYLRTGDLGFVRDGELYVTGRLKDLIILEGRNHYPQDIERTAVAAHCALRPDCCAAFSVDITGKERLVVVCEVEARYYRDTRRENNGSSGAGVSSGETEEILRAVRRAVSERHDIRVHSVVLLKTGRLQKTSSGKIQRHACRAKFLAETLDRI